MTGDLVLHLPIPSLLWCTRRAAEAKVKTRRERRRLRGTEDRSRQEVTHGGPGVTHGGRAEDASEDIPRTYEVVRSRFPGFPSPPGGDNLGDSFEEVCISLNFPLPQAETIPIVRR